MDPAGLLFLGALIVGVGAAVYSAATGGSQAQWRQRRSLKRARQFAALLSQAKLTERLQTRAYVSRLPEDNSPGPVVIEVGVHLPQVPSGFVLEAQRTSAARHAQRIAGARSRELLALLPASGLAEVFALIEGGADLDGTLLRAQVSEERFRKSQEVVPWVRDRAVAITAVAVHLSKLFENQPAHLVRLFKEGDVDRLSALRCMTYFYADHSQTDALCEDLCEQGPPPQQLVAGLHLSGTYLEDVLEGLDVASTAAELWNDALHAPRRPLPLSCRLALMRSALQHLDPGVQVVAAEMLEPIGGRGELASLRSCVKRDDIAEPLREACQQAIAAIQLRLGEPVEGNLALASATGEGALSLSDASAGGSLSLSEGAGRLAIDNGASPSGKEPDNES